jgi:hypothetical protein
MSLVISLPNLVFTMNILKLPFGSFGSVSLLAAYFQRVANIHLFRNTEMDLWITKYHLSIIYFFISHYYPCLFPPPYLDLLFKTLPGILSFPPFSTFSKNINYSIKYHSWIFIGCLQGGKGNSEEREKNSNYDM